MFLQVMLSPLFWCFPIFPRHFPGQLYTGGPGNQNGQDPDLLHLMNKVA